MPDQQLVVAMLGEARFRPYLVAAGNDSARALDLYLWVTEVSGALHAQTSFVEIAVRNALDPVIAEWNESQGDQYSPDWTVEDGAAPLLYSMLHGPLNRARSWARNEARSRPAGHPRRNATPTHDDVLTQLTFGVWSSLIYGQREDHARQQQLWKEATHRAFPHVAHAEESRRLIGQQLNNIRALRNRVAHHDNLLDVQLAKRLGWTLSLLAKINPEYPRLATARSPIRRLIREDPRRSW